MLREYCGLDLNRAIFEMKDRSRRDLISASRLRLFAISDDLAVQRFQRQKTTSKTLLFLQRGLED